MLSDLPQSRDFTLSAELEKKSAHIFDLSKRLGDIVRFHAAHNGVQTAILFGQKTISYHLLDKDSNRLANALLALNLPSQARIVYLGKESEKYYTLLFACAKANFVLVPVNWRLKLEEVKHILEDSQAKVLLVSAEFEEMVVRLQQVGVLLEKCVYLEARPDKTFYDDWLQQYPASDPHADVSPGSIIAQMYTSGTTGLPKGVELAHHCFFEIRVSLLENGLDWLDWRQNDISLIGIPGFHIGGLWWSLQGFSAGATNLCMPQFLASDALRLMLEHKVSIACLVPAMINMLLMEIGSHQCDFSALRKIVYGGSPVSEALLLKSIAVFGCDFAQIYGLTETGNTAVCLPPDDHFKGSKYLTAAGKPYPCVALKIIDAKQQILPLHEVGEVCIKTPAHMKGYWNLPEATAETLVDGWIHTGDAGYLDEEGYLYISDRIKDAIIVAGENIYPAEVENAISKHPGVNDVAVIGIPDQKWGEAAAAFVVTGNDDELTATALFTFLKSHIADYKIPAKFYFVDKIPRNPSGKILRRELRDIFWEGCARKV